MNANPKRGGPAVWALIAALACGSCMSMEAPPTSGSASADQAAPTEIDRLATEGRGPAGAQREEQKEDEPQEQSENGLDGVLMGRGGSEATVRPFDSLDLGEMNDAPPGDAWNAVPAAAPAKPKSKSGWMNKMEVSGKARSKGKTDASNNESSTAVLDPTSGIRLRDAMQPSGDEVFVAGTGLVTQGYGVKAAFDGDAVFFDSEEDEEADIPEEEPAPESVTAPANKPVAVRVSRKQEKSQREVDSDRRAKPERFLPRMLYFENTYVGGQAGYLEARRRLAESLGDGPFPHELAAPVDADLDAPSDHGMRLTATLDQRWVGEPGRVMLQVGLRGSDRYGWRRPPLEIVLVVDGAAQSLSPDDVTELTEEMVRQLGPEDRFAVVQATAAGGRVLAPLESPRWHRVQLAPALERLEGLNTTADLEGALRTGANILADPANSENRVPGTRILLVLTASKDERRARRAESVAHELTTQGIFTSVVESERFGSARAGAWWRPAQAGYGNYHRMRAGQAASVVEAEFNALSRVVARLLRVNVKLAPGVEAIRVLGSRVLDDEEVEQVKAREVATDRQLSRAMGIQADRGDDDDGLQTVVPYFYGGDTHSIFIELWVDKPGAVADVTLKYKDLVSLGNQEARAAVSLSATPRPPTGLERAVSLAAEDAEVGVDLMKAAILIERGHTQRARAILDEVEARAPRERDRQAAASLRVLLGQARRGAIGPQLLVSAAMTTARAKLGGGR